MRSNETCLYSCGWLSLNDSGTGSFLISCRFILCTSCQTYMGQLNDHGKTDAALLAIGHSNHRNQQTACPKSNGRWMRVNARPCNASRGKAQLTITPPAQSLSSKQKADTQNGHMPRTEISQRPKDEFAFGIDPYEYASQAWRLCITHMFFSDPDHSLDWFKGNVGGNSTQGFLSTNQSWTIQTKILGYHMGKLPL